MSTTEPLSVTFARAAEITGHSVATIRRAVDKGELTARFRTTKPVIEWDELQAWIHTAPTESKKAATP